MKISIIIPIYNEEKNLHPNLKKIEKYIFSHCVNCECIFIDDASIDSSLEILKDFQKNSPLTIKIVVLEKNSGQHNAILAGMEYAKGDYIITIDADLQIPINNLSKILENIDSKYDIISGKRYKRNDPLIRKIMSFLLNRQISHIFKKKIYDIGSMFRSYKREVVDNILLNKKSSTFIPTLALSLGYKMKEIKVSHFKRKDDKSKYSLLRLFDLYINLISEIVIIPKRFLTLSQILFFMLIFFLLSLSIFFKTNIIILIVLFILSLLTFTSFIFILILNKKRKNSDLQGYKIKDIIINKNQRFLFIVEKKYLSIYKKIKKNPGSVFVFKKEKDIDDILTKSFKDFEQLDNLKFFNNVFKKKQSNFSSYYIKNIEMFIQFLGSLENINIILITQNTNRIEKYIDKYLNNKTLLHIYHDLKSYKYKTDKKNIFKDIISSLKQIID